MKKKDFIQGFKIVVLGLILGLGLGMSQVVAWNYPTHQVGIGDSDPLENTDIHPINVGPNPLNQIEAVFAGSSTLKGGLNVNGFTVNSGAYFAKSVHVGPGPVVVKDPPPILEVLGDKQISGKLVITTLAGTVNERKVCTNSVGKLIICP